MKIILALLLASLGLLTGCESVPANRAVTMQRIDHTGQQGAFRGNSVAKQTQESQPINGT